MVCWSTASGWKKVPCSDKGAFSHRAPLAGTGLGPDLAGAGKVMGSRGRTMRLRAPMLPPAALPGPMAVMPAAMLLHGGN
jgi:hypothetical protein